MIEKQDILKLIEDREVSKEVYSRQLDFAMKSHDQDAASKNFKWLKEAQQELEELNTFLSLFDKYAKEVEENEEWQMIEDAEKACGM